jgi:hypothetical protein
MALQEHIVTFILAGEALIINHSGLTSILVLWPLIVAAWELWIFFLGRIFAAAVSSEHKPYFTLYCIDEN